MDANAAQRGHSQIAMGKEKNRDKYPGERCGQDVKPLDNKELAFVYG